jgi:serine/threonine protein kinase
MTEVVRERVQDGATGETKDLQYTQCKVVGNGSFGVVFQIKLAPNNEDAAIKRVLQDKRFKVGLGPWLSVPPAMLTTARIVSSKSCALFGIPTLCN